MLRVLTLIALIIALTVGFLLPLTYVLARWRR
jgi:hypothetical protein